MGLMMRILLILMFLTTIIATSNAGWQGPTAIVNGIWGSGVGQFGFESGDSSDIFPKIEAITSDGRIVIADIVNKKQLVFNIVDGSFIEEVTWTIKAQSGDKTTYSIPEYSFGHVLGYSSDGNLYTSSGNNYFLKSSTGQVIKTATTKPAELGYVNEKPLGNGKYKVTVTYPDRVWSYLGPGVVPKYIRDTNGNLYGSGERQAIRWSFCGKELARLTMPKGYGSPFLGPNGDVYTWERTPDVYSILKWTWVDDPNVPSGPDAPTNLAVAASINGLYLTWTASPQDPGCVTGYEIDQATTSGGPYTVLTTVNAGTLKYNDTSATAGTMYYYKIRAVSGSDYSLYTTEVSGKR